MADDKQFSITDLAREFDLTTRAIRFYEDQGLLTPVRQGQRRIYSNRERVRLKLILRGKRLGFALSEVKELFDLYDATHSEEQQLVEFLKKLEERRQLLLQQREDIDAMLDEIDVFSTQVRAALGSQPSIERPRRTRSTSRA